MIDGLFAGDLAQHSLSIRTDMPQRIRLLVSRNSFRLFAFDYDLIARVLAHVEVRSGNTHGEGRRCAA